MHVNVVAKFAGKGRFDAHVTAEPAAAVIARPRLSDQISRHAGLEYGTELDLSFGLADELHRVVDLIETPDIGLANISVLFELFTVGLIGIAMEHLLFLRHALRWRRLRRS